MSARKTVYLKIKRQTSPQDKPYWEDFSLEYNEKDTLLALLTRLSDAPCKDSTPVHHECNCKEEICGTCTIRVNGRPCMSCSKLVGDLPISSSKRPIILEPLEKFPVIRDLTVDKSRIFRSLTRVKSWLETDELFGPSVTYSQNVQLEMYSYAKCINCGICYDACPRTSKIEGMYIGPSAVAHVVTMNDHPLGKGSQEERLKAIMRNDGVSKCGKALICEKVCPKKVPLIRSVARANREVLSKIFR